MSYKQLLVDIFNAKMDAYPRVGRALESVALDLAEAIAAESGARENSYDMVWGSMPRLFQLHLNRGGPLDNFGLFALSFGEFSRRFRTRNLFKGLVTDDDLIVSAFDMHCRGGELFLVDAGPKRPSQIPVTRIDVDFVRSLDEGAMNDLFKKGYSAISDFHTVTQLYGMNDASREVAHLLMEARSLFRLNDAPSMALLVKMIYGDGMRSSMQAFTKRFEEWFLVDLSENVIAGASAALEHVEAGNMDGIISEVDELLDRVNNGANAIRQFGSLCTRLKVILNLFYPKGGDAVTQSEYAEWPSYLVSVSMFTHDYANMMSKVVGSIQLLASKLAMGKRGVSDIFADMQAARESLKEILRSFDSSEVATLMRLVKWMLKMRSQDRIVVDTEGIGSLRILARVRPPLFRMLFELGQNAIKYRVSGSDEHRVDLGAGLDGSMLRFTVEDNGVGIEDVQKAALLGVRERPELAEGTGTGLASVMVRAREIGAVVRINSVPGAGTKVTVDVDTAGWGRGGGLGGGSGGGGVRTLGALPQMQMCGAMNMAFGANPVLIAFRPLSLALA